MSVEEKLIEQLVRTEEERGNQKYGKCILQTNEIQFYLAGVVLIESSLPNKTYMEYLFEQAELGTLITLFQACARKTPESYRLLSALKDYNAKRRRLAHKMFSKKKLTLDECNSAIVKGENILKELQKLTRAQKAKDK